MSSQPAAIWILDCANFLDYLDVCFERMGNHLQHREDLINWIIGEQLWRVYCLGTRNHHPVTEYQIIHNQLIVFHDLDRNTSKMLPIPKCRGDAEIVIARRVAGALVIEYHNFPQF